MHKNIKLLLKTIPVCIVLLSFAGLEFTNYFSWGPDYRNNVRAHMENAYWANTPELMIQELEAAKAGMQELGLTPEMYGDIRPWKQFPNVRMQYQYAHLDSIISRAHDVIEWRDSHTGRGEINDVYGAKMRDLRNFILEDTWSDWIAEKAYYVNYHPTYALYRTFGWIPLLASIALAVSPLASRALRIMKQIKEENDK